MKFKIKFPQWLGNKQGGKKQEKDTNSSSSSPSFGLGSLIGAFITITVGVSLIPIISDSIKWVAKYSDIEGTSQTLLNAIPIFFALGIVFMSFMIIWSILRPIGVSI